MIAVLKRSLDLKLAASLFFVLGLVFVVFVLSVNHLHLAEKTKWASQISEQISQDDSQILKNFSKQDSSSSLGGMIFIGIGCFLFAMLLMGAIFQMMFLRPLKAITRHLDHSTSGTERDLTIRISSQRTDEIGILANCFDTFVSNLDEIIMNIGRKTETIAAASSEVSIASEQMNEESSDLYTRSNSVAASAEEMNSSMHTVAAASEEASTNIAIVADAAGQMQINISGVAQNCEKAKEISNTARQQVDTATKNVGHLGDAAKEISKVTQVITDIAEQTNLLALNATIEAARAGEAGKGFAVVAGEIKNLASQTAEATQSIRKKIEAIQNSTKDTVDEVGHISQVILSVDEIVNQIAKAIEEQSNMATEVATNVEQASIGISEVNENVAQSSQVASEIASDIARVDGVAAEMSNRAANMTTGAKDLDTLSMKLREMISIFRVSRKETQSAPESGLVEKNIPDLMPWSSKLQTSINEIDNQHKELVRLINLLHRAMRMQKGAGEVGGILKDLSEYTVFHFDYEEKLFKKYEYPEYRNHKKIHEDLVGQVVAFQNDFNNGKATITMDLMDFLTEWLKTHIMKTDMAYAPFLKDKMKKV